MYVDIKYVFDIRYIHIHRSIKTSESKKVCQENQFVTCSLRFNAFLKPHQKAELGFW